MWKSKKCLDADGKVVQIITNIIIIKTWVWTSTILFTQLLCRFKIAYNLLTHTYNKENVSSKSLIRLTLSLARLGWFGMIGNLDEWNFVFECDLAVVNESKNISFLFCSAMYFVNIQKMLTFLAMPQYIAHWSQIDACTVIFSQWEDEHAILRSLFIVV